MGRQQIEIVDALVVAGSLVDMQGEGLVVLHVDRGDALVKLRTGDAGFRMPADLPGEEHVLRRHRRAVAPDRFRPDRVGQRDTVLAVGGFLRHRRALFDIGQFGAQHADQLPVGVVDRERSPRHGQHIALGQHRIDVRVEIAGELADADHQFVAGRRRRRRRRAQQQQADGGRRDHRQNQHQNGAFRGHRSGLRFG